MLGLSSRNFPAHLPPACSSPTTSITQGSQAASTQAGCMVCSLNSCTWPAQKALPWFRVLWSPRNSLSFFKKEPSLYLLVWAP